MGSAFALTDIGRVKRSNQDRFLIDDELGLYLVADGMGGHAAGEVASAIAVEVVEQTIRAGLPGLDLSGGGGRERAQELVEDAVRRACRTIFLRAEAEPEKRGMGTTTSLALIKGGRAYLAHVGDSRIYLLRREEVLQLTDDHSLVAEMARLGKMTPEEASRLPFKNAITRAVGVYADVQVDTLVVDVLAGDRLLICSDGLHNHLRDAKELLELGARHPLKELPKALVDLANGRGGKDNITALVVDVTPEQGADPRALELEMVRRMPLFQHLTPVEQVTLLDLSELRTCEAGEPIFAEGSPGEELFVVFEGQVSLRRGEQELAVLGPGAHFGEMSVLDRKPRSAGAVALTESRLIALERKALFRILRRNPELAVKLLWSFVVVLSNRLRTANDVLCQVRSEHKELEDLFQLGRD